MNEHQKSRKKSVHSESDENDCVDGEGEKEITTETLYEIKYIKVFESLKAFNDEEIREVWAII